MEESAGMKNGGIQFWSLQPQHGSRQTQSFMSKVLKLTDRSCNTKPQFPTQVPNSCLPLLTQISLTPP